MLLSAMKYCRGYVYVQLTGYAPERFLNLCGNHDILIWNLKPCEEGYCFCISVAGFKSLKPILRKTRTHIKILKKCGLPFTVFRYRKRKVYVTGIVFFAALLYYLSGFVWNIEVNGNSYLSEEVILDFLKEERASFGAKKTEIDCAELEEALRSRYSEVIWTSIKIYGTKMTVDIQENLLPEEQYERKDDIVYDIVAAKDGIVSDIITRSGTPYVAAGAEVKKGDLLVSGKLEVLDDNGEVAQYLYNSADADITATVVCDYRDVIAADYEKQVSVGEPKTDYHLIFFETALKNPFFHLDTEEYEMTADTSQLHFSDNFYLPVYFVRQTYQPCENQPAVHSEEEIRQIATENLSKFMDDLEEKGIQIIEKNVIIKKQEKNYVVTGTITVHESIVSYQPTDLNNTETKKPPQ